MKQNIKVFIYVNQVLFLFCKNACVRDCSNNTMHPKTTKVTKGLSPFCFTECLCNHQGKSKYSRKWNGQLGLTACQTPLPNLTISTFRIYGIKFCGVQGFPCKRTNDSDSNLVSQV